MESWMPIKNLYFEEYKNSLKWMTAVLALWERPCFIFNMVVCADLISQDCGWASTRSRLPVFNRHLGRHHTESGRHHSETWLMNYSSHSLSLYFWVQQSLSSKNIKSCVFSRVKMWSRWRPAVKRRKRMEAWLVNLFKTSLRMSLCLLAIWRKRWRTNEICDGHDVCAAHNY